MTYHSNTSATQILYHAAGKSEIDGQYTSGVCWLCGAEFEGDATPVGKIIKPTFTNIDMARRPESEWVCAACVFSFDERNEQLAQLVGKDKPQRMRNYSHFVLDGRWIPLSKGDKSGMRNILLKSPELAVVAISGQKHLIFRAQPGWWQIEEEKAQPFPDELSRLIGPVEELYTAFSKGEIESGQYAQHRIMRYGINRWYALERQIAPMRGSVKLQLAVFLAQKKRKENDGRRTKGESGGAVVSDMERGAGRLQEPLPGLDMDSI